MYVMFSHHMGSCIPTSGYKAGRKIHMNQPVRQEDCGNNEQKKTERKWTGKRILILTHLHSETNWQRHRHREREREREREGRWEGEGEGGREGERGRQRERERERD